MGDFLECLIFSFYVLVVFVIGMLIGNFGVGTHAGAMLGSLIGGVIGVKLARSNYGDDGFLPDIGETTKEFLLKHLMVASAVTTLAITGSLIASIFGFIAGAFVFAIISSIDFSRETSLSNYYREEEIMEAFKEGLREGAEERRRSGL